MWHKCRGPADLRRHRHESSSKGKSFEYVQDTFGCMTYVNFRFVAWIFCGQIHTTFMSFAVCFVGWLGRGIIEQSRTRFYYKIWYQQGQLPINSQASGFIMNSKKLAILPTSTSGSSSSSSSNSASQLTAVSKQSVKNKELLIRKEFKCKTCGGTFERSEELLRVHLNENMLVWFWCVTFLFFLVHIWLKHWNAIIYFQCLSQSDEPVVAMCALFAGVRKVCLVFASHQSVSLLCKGWYFRDVGV